MPTSGWTCDKFAIRFLELDWYGQPSSNVGHRSQELLQGRLGLVTNAGAGDQRNEQSQTQTLGTGMRVRYSRVWGRDCGMNCGLICVLCIMACFVLKNFQLENLVAKVISKWPGFTLPVLGTRILIVSEFEM